MLLSWSNKARQQDGMVELATPLYLHCVTTPIFLAVFGFHGRLHDTFPQTHRHFLQLSLCARFPTNVQQIPFRLQPFR